MSEETSEEQVDDLLGELRRAEASSVVAHEHGNVGERIQYEKEADTLEEQILQIVKDLVSEQEEMREWIKNWERFYDDPCYAERISDEDTGEPQWLLHSPKESPEVLENHICFDPAAFEEGARVCIYEPLKGNKT